MNKDTFYALKQDLEDYVERSRTEHFELCEEHFAEEYGYRYEYRSDLGNYGEIYDEVCSYLDKNSFY